MLVNLNCCLSCLKRNHTFSNFCTNCFALDPLCLQRLGPKRYISENINVLCIFKGTTKTIDDCKVTVKCKSCKFLSILSHMFICFLFSVL